MARGQCKILVKVKARIKDQHTRNDDLATLKVMFEGCRDKKEDHTCRLVDLEKYLTIFPKPSFGKH